LAHANEADILLAMGRSDEALVEIQKETDEEYENGGLTAA
jgi:hypothetical protein